MLEHEYDIMRRVEDEHWWYAALRRMVVNDVKAFQRSRPPCSILDAGCGTGGMLFRLHAENKEWKLCGIDYSEHAVASTSKRDIAEITNGSVNKMPYPDASFDVVLILDVLYHNGVDEAQTLAECHRVLRPGGMFVINLAAFDVLRGAHDIAVNGARRYTPSRVRHLLEQIGLEVEQLYCWNAWLFPPLMVWRLLSRLGKWDDPGQTKGDLSPVEAVLNAALTAVSYADSTICRLLHFPVGTSVYAVARKP